MEKNSILKEALLQVESLEDAVKTNAKGILASAMKESLSDLLSEQDEKEKKVEVKEKDIPDEDNSDKDEKDVPDEVIPDDEDDDDESDLPDETDVDVPDNDEVIDDKSDEEEPIDMTGASDDEVLKVFKAMKPGDGISVKKNGDDIEFKDNGEEYLIKSGSELSVDKLGDSLDEQDDDNVDDSNDEIGSDDIDRESDVDEQDDEDSEESDDSDDEFDSEFDPDKYSDSTDDDSEEDDSDIFEIDLGDEDSDDNEEDSEVEEASDKKSPVEKDTNESARTLGYGYHGGLKSKKVFKAGNKRFELAEQFKKLRKQNDEYKKALVLFKQKLNEIAIFNANLTYTTKLITENTTTKSEKENIVKRFDSVNSLQESKDLYKTIKEELLAKKTPATHVEEKITSMPSTSTSKETLSESKIFENPQFKRIRELMDKLKK